MKHGYSFFSKNYKIKQSWIFTENCYKALLNSAKHAQKKPCRQHDLIYKEKISVTWVDTSFCSHGLWTLLPSQGTVLIQYRAPGSHYQSMEKNTHAVTYNYPVSNKEAWVLVPTIVSQGMKSRLLFVSTSSLENR